MIKSMTGYGKTIIQLPAKKITIEIKSLNSKNIDLNTRFPAIYREKEIFIRRKLAKQLIRGKIDISFYIESTGEESTSKINKDIVSNYMQQLKDIDPDADYLSIVMRLPDVLKTEREELDDAEWMEIEKGIDGTIDLLEEFRKDEGEVLKRDFVLRIDSIRENLEGVIHLDKDRLEAVRVKLLKAINELEVTVDENRFEQELIYYLEKLDITEEKVRLVNHLDYFIKELDGTVSNGKKLAFISQEIGREVNTIGSKANFAPMQKLVVQMKDDLEKIKEQLLNVL
ncbi:MAG: YicC family protein [Bacteroidetes bacterium]|nr:MAG: YicC family protein [Bacteroidota bacterium]